MARVAIFNINVHPISAEPLIAISTQGTFYTYATEWWIDEQPFYQHGTERDCNVYADETQSCHMQCNRSSGFSRSLRRQFCQKGSPEHHIALHKQIQRPGDL